MELWEKISVFSHIIFGTLTLLTGPIAIFFNLRDTRRHRLVGKVFFYSMLWVCATAIVGWLRRPDDVFYQFLLGIAVIVLAGILNGVRAIFIMKHRPVSFLDYGINIGLLMSGGIMLSEALRHFNNKDTIIALPILFTVFGFGAVNDSIKALRRLLRATDLSPNQWLITHVTQMLGAFIASTTAFTVNAAHFLPWYAQWFGPTVLLVPVIFWWVRKLKARETAMQA